MKMPDMSSLKDIFSRAVDALEKTVNPAVKKLSHFTKDVEIAFCEPCGLSRNQKLYHGAKTVALTGLFISSIVAINPEAIAATTFAIGDEINYLDQVGDHARKILEMSQNLK